MNWLNIKPRCTLGRRMSFMIAAALATSAFASLVVAQTPSEASGHFYDPIERDVEGWTVKLDPSLLDEDDTLIGERALTALANHLQRVKYIVLPEKVKELQALPIWLELHNESLSNMQYHPSQGWLRQNGHDPRLVKHVHIPRAGRLLDPRQWAKHPYAVLHELAHAYHDQRLSWDYPDIIRAFNAAKSSGNYEAVLSHTGRTVMHYGMNNHKEYFAEMTEAYLGVNDFYPFVRAELKEHDPQMYELMEKVWGKIR